MIEAFKGHTAGDGGAGWNPLAANQGPDEGCIPRKLWQVLLPGMQEENL